MMAVGYFTNYMPTDAPWSVIIPTCVMFSCINFLSVGVWAMMGRSLQNKLLNPIHRKRFNITMALLLVFSMIPVLFL
jgi:threonine/homoserine/homoserine lactone efflux protein